MIPTAAGTGSCPSIFPRIIVSPTKGTGTWTLSRTLTQLPPQLRDFAAQAIDDLGLVDLRMIFGGCEVCTFRFKATNDTGVTGSRAVALVERVSEAIDAEWKVAVGKSREFRLASSCSSSNLEYSNTSKGTYLDLALTTSYA